MRLRNLFRRRFTYLETKGMEMIVVDPDSKDTAEYLGISEERVKELLGAMAKHVTSGKDCLDIIVHMSHQCKHANELAFVVYSQGRYCERVCNNPIRKFMEQLKG